MSHLQAAIGEDVDSEVDKPLALNRNIGYEDMTQMEEMDLESLLGNCRLRYAHDQIYTYTGTILVAINPFKRVPIYGPNWLKLYPHQRIGSQPPHVYAIAEAAFSAMGEKNKNQSMLISGESGAGKTETTKLILRYLTRRAHLEISGGMTADKTTKDKGVEKKILESVPILEALGNAKTLRNDNSSRFGKYIEVQFNKDNRIVGSKITPYLLEKSRIVHQLPGERNFHIFYQLTEGASDETRARYHFGRAMDYEYLNKSGCIALSWSSYDEASALKGFEEALTIFAISEKARDGMYRILSAILHLGNVLWVDAEVSGVVNIANDKAQQALNLAAELLGFAPEQLKYQLSHQRVVIAGETIWKNLDAQQCRYLTDSFAKAIYSKLFDWLVLKLNASMHADAGGHRTKNTIGVLDIFGFENFVNNSFEQFLINYCNEQLQKFFNHYIFALEQAEYEREKIDWSLIDFVDNQATLDLIDRNKPTGILALLDDQCRQPKSTDQTYIDACHKLFGEGQTQLYNKIRLKRTHFAVTHYAGQVEYNVAGWLDKNKDELPVHLTEAVVNDSTNTFAALLFSDPEKEERPSVSTSASSLSASSSSSSASSSSPAGAANSRVTRTTGAYFKQQLKSLMDNLALTEPHFVRTIKPNLQAKPNTFDDAEIQAQLLYAGMLETIRIRRLGYPVRFPFADFLYKFHVLRPSFPRDADPRKSCQNLVTALGISLQNIQVGLNKVFLKQDTANGLEEMRGIALSGAVIRIQTWWRMASLRRLFLVKKFAATQIQAAFRGHAQKKRFQRIKKSALIAQRAIRRYQARQILIRLKNDRAAYLKHLSAMEKAELERKAAEAQAVETQKFELLLAQQATKKKKNKNQEAAGSEDAAAAAAAAAGEGADAASTAAEGTSEAAEGDTSVASSSVPPQEAPPVILENKIYLTVAYPSGRSIHASATVLMFRFHKLRDHTSELNDISRDTALEHVGQGQVVVPPNVPGLTQDASFHGETFTVNFPHISNKTTTLACLLNIFSRDTTFEGNSILVTLTDAKTKNNLASAYFPITYATAEQSGMLCCQFLREGASRWVFKPEGRLLPGRNYKLSMPSLIDMLPVPPRPRAFDVTIHGARGLGAVRDTPPDTYAVVSLDVSRFNTPVSKKEINPNWNFYGRLVGQAHVIDLRVYAKVAWAGDTLVGSAVIPFSDTELLQMKEQWIKLDRRGQVHFSIIETRADAPLPERAHEQEAAKRPATLTRRLSQSRLTRMSISLPKPSPSSSSASIPQLMDLASFSITTGVAATPRSAPESMARELKSVAHNTVIQRFTFEGLPHHVKTIPLNVEMTAADILVEVAQRIEVAPDSLELCDRVVGRLEPIIIDSTPVAHDQAELQTPRGTQIKNARQLLKVTAAGRIVLSNRDLVVCPRGWAAAKYPPVVRPTSSSSSSSKSRKSRKSSSSSSSSSSSKSSSKKRSFFGRK